MRLSIPQSMLLRRPLVRLGLLVTLLTGLIAIGSLITFAQDDTQNQNPPPPLQGTITYTIQYGDVLDVIAQRYDVSLLCIIERNGLTSTINLLPGYPLELSRECPPYDGIFPPPGSLDVGQGGGGDASGSAANATVEANPGERVHIIRSGDVLDLIALSFNVQLQCLRERNAITSNLAFFPGDVIVIPGNCPPYDGLSTLPPGWSLPGSEGIVTLSSTATPLSLPTQAPPTAVATEEVAPPTAEQFATLAADTDPPIRATLVLEPVILPTVTPTNVG